jgi:uncharacterized membrane protein
VINLRLCRITLLRLLAALVIISLLMVPSAYTQETEDSQAFIAGFNAFQQKDYVAAIKKMNEVLQKYPDTPLRDMALFWLARSYYRNGNNQNAAKYLSQFSKEYPDNPLKGTVEEELLNLVARYERGESLASAPVPGTGVAARKAAPSEQERSAAEQAAQIKADKERAALKVEAERQAAAAEKARIAAVTRERERIAAEQAAKVRAEQERVAALKAEAERKAAEAAAAEKARSAATKREQDRIAAEQAAKAKAQQLAKLEQERIAAEQAAQAKAEQMRAVVLKAEAERKAAEAAAAEKARSAAVQREQERIAAEQAAKAKAQQLAKLERERIAAAQAAKVKAEQERVAAVKAEAERKATVAAAAAAEKARSAEEKARAARSTYREKAIAQYKAIIGTYPGTPAATTAAAKLRELGLAVALPPVPVTEPPLENSQVLRLQVAQYAGFEFNVLPRPDTYTIASTVMIPFEIINRGNGSDSFSLESSFPAEFRTRFASSAHPEVSINQTPQLASGESFKGVLLLNIPVSNIDGQRIVYPIKVVSRVMTEASQSREVRLVVSAPLLRAVLKVDKSQPLPGEKMVYRIAVLNVGSTVAHDVTLRLSFPQQLEAVDSAAAGFRQELKSTLVLDGLQVKSGENREFSVTFQLKDDSLAGQEISVRAELINKPLQRTAAFVSNVASVHSRHGVLAHTASERLVVIPGQTVSVPFVVSNTGNVREKFKVTASVKDTQDAVIFHDVNRDGIRQAGEPVIREIGPLAPKEEACVGVEIRTLRSAPDGSRGDVQVVFVSEGDEARSASGTTQLLYSRPLLQLDMVGRDSSLKPGEIASFDLTVVNKGSNLAQVVELQSTWPELLELVAAEPVNSVAADGRIIWRFKEVGAGEKRSIKVSFRVKAGTGAGTNVQVKNILIYEDQLGNKY